MTSLAAVFHSPAQPLELRRFPLPVPAEGETLVRIRCSTICGSDLHSRFGRRHCPAPAILGHEMVGEIVATGNGGAHDYRGRPLRIGERVTWSMVWSCGDCYFCLRNLRPKCERLMKFGHEPISPAGALHGGMAEYCLLPAGTAIFPVPHNIPDMVAAPANCATATVAAVLRTAGPVKGEVVVILGAGMLGLTACAMAAANGAACVIVVEPVEERRQRALLFGAHVALNSESTPGELAAAIRERSQNRGADAVLEFAGVPDSVEPGPDLLRTGGRFILAGSVFPSRPVRFSAEQMVRRMLHFTGVHNYAPEDLETALVFLRDHIDLHPFADLIGPAFPLAQVNEALEYAEKTKPPRVALLP